MIAMGEFKPDAPGTSRVGPPVHPITRARFDAFAGYCRARLVRTLAHGLAWFESADGEVLATLIVDTDVEYSGIVLARDLQERFRWVNQAPFLPAADRAVAALQDLVERTRGVGVGVLRGHLRRPR